MEMKDLSYLELIPYYSDNVYHHGATWGKEFERRSDLAFIQMMADVCLASVKKLFFVRRSVIHEEMIDFVLPPFVQDPGPEVVYLPSNVLLHTNTTSSQLLDSILLNVTRTVCSRLRGMEKETNSCRSYLYIVYTCSCKVVMSYVRNEERFFANAWNKRHPKPCF